MALNPLSSRDRQKSILATLLDAPASWADFERFLGYADGKVVQINGGQLVRDRTANVPGLLAGPGWRPYRAVASQFSTNAQYVAYLGAGNTEVAFKTSSPSVARPVVYRARDSVSALDLMSAGGLDSAIRNREVTRADATEITSLFQEILSECAEKQWSLDVPAGTYHLNSRLTADFPVTFTGAGRDRSRLDWGNGSSSAGIRIKSGGSFHHASVRGITLLTNESTPVHTAIEIDYSALAGSGTIVPRANTHASVQDVRIGSSNGGVASGWNKGVDGISLLGLDVTDCRINGAIQGSIYGNLPSAAAGITMRGAGSPVQLTVNRTYVSGMMDAVRTEDVEGVYLSNYEFVNVGWGYRTNNTAIESGFTISGGHINSLIGGIFLQNMGDGIISGNTFYHIEAGAASEIRHVVLGSNTPDITVSDNVFRRHTSSKTVVSIDIVGGRRANIGRNTHHFDGGDQENLAVRIGAAAVNPLIAMQSFDVVPSGRQFENNCDTSQFEVFRGYAGDLSNIYTDWRMPVQVHQLVPGASGLPSGLTAAGCIVETMSHDLLTAVQVLRSSGTNNWYQRRKSGGVWTDWFTYGPTA